MKNKKWLNYTLGILLTLVVLTVVAGAGFRAGMMQNFSFPRIANGVHPSFARGFGDLPERMKDNTQGNVNPHLPQGNSPQGMRDNFQNNNMPQGFQRQAFDNARGFDRRNGGFPLLSPLFGLIRLVVLGLLVWVGYKFVKKSGWKLSLSKAVTASAPAPSPSETPVMEVEEKKETE
jgi:hypothetical protein